MLAPPELDPHAPTKRSRWHQRRLVQLALLVGQGKTAKQIARHPVICSNAAAVLAQCHRLGLALSETPRGRVTIAVRPAALQAFQAAGEARAQSAEGVMARYVDVAGDEPAIIDNVLDDGVAA